jgi:hypothetical protein
MMRWWSLPIPICSLSEKHSLPVAPKVKAPAPRLENTKGYASVTFKEVIQKIYDDKHRVEGVARRLVQEAKSRQAIVFTHDVVFLLLLKQFAKELSVEQFDQHVQHLPKGAGI